MRPSVAATDIRRDLVSLLPKLRRFALTLTGNAVEADELVQHVCQRGIAKINQWNSDIRLDSWLYTIARHQWIDESRRHKFRQGVTKGGAVHQGGLAAQLSPIEATETHPTMMSLPDGLASVFLLIDVEGHSYKQAADILGIPLSTITTRLANARLKLATMGHARSSRRS